MITKRIQRHLPHSHCHSSTAAFYRCHAFYSTGLAGALVPCCRSAPLSSGRRLKAAARFAACEVIFRRVPHQHRRQTSVRRALQWGEEPHPVLLRGGLFIAVVGLSTVRLCLRRFSIYQGLAAQPPPFCFLLGHYLSHSQHQLRLGLLALSAFALSACAA